MIRRKVYISQDHIDMASKSKPFLEALAFCVYVKLNVTSSRLDGVTYRRLQEASHLGHSRIKRIIQLCDEKRLVRREGNSLIFSRIKQDNAFNYHIFNHYDKRKGKALSFNLSLNFIMDCIRKMIVERRVKGVQNMEQTYNLGTSELSSEKARRLKRADRKAIRVASKKVRRLALDKASFTISYKSLANIMSCGRSKAIKLVKQMKGDEVISSQQCNVKIADMDKYVNVRELMEYYLYDIKRGYVFMGSDLSLYMRYPNKYRLLKNSHRRYVTPFDRTTMAWENSLNHESK